ncbi:hypothetical protein GE21DRAFT_1312107 [Neurospora crassa]|nr:hypothetical protein GE21DRAFT_1312107 [Neurospora crassa]
MSEATKFRNTVGGSNTIGGSYCSVGCGLYILAGTNSLGLTAFLWLEIGWQYRHFQDSAGRVGSCKEDVDVGSL